MAVVNIHYYMSVTAKARVALTLRTLTTLHNLRQIYVRVTTKPEQRNSVSDGSSRSYISTHSSSERRAGSRL